MNITSSKDLFSLYLTNKIISKVIEYSNIIVKTKYVNYADQTSTVSDSTELEFAAFLGLLVLSAI